MHRTAVTQDIIWRMSGANWYKGELTAGPAREWGSQLVLYPPQNMNDTENKEDYTD